MNREQPTRSRRTLVLFAMVALAVAVLDQFTKYLVTAYVPLHESVPVVSGYVNLVHVRNPGAAFGILAGFGGVVRSAFFILVSVAALVVILWLASSSEANNAWLLSGYALFFGGALGNLVDRLRFGEVVDFIDVHVGPYHWPAFNVADSALCVGTAAFFVYFLFKRNAA